MRDYKLLSVRDGQRAVDDGPLEGVPEHLLNQLVEWLNRQLRSDRGKPSQTMIDLMAVRLRVEVNAADASKAATGLLSAVRADSQLLLDAIDLRLQIGQVDSAEIGKLHGLLGIGGSVWGVNSQGDGLVRRVDVIADAAYARATSPQDEASDELRQAWNAIYGRHPDPSDAWDHAIKAVEHLVISIVVPKQDKPTLGHVLGQLRGNQDAYATELGEVTTLLSMLELIWPNPDRHGNAHQRPPRQGEAEAVVLLAVTLVQWLRTGFLRKR